MAAGDRPVEVVIPAIGVRSSLVDLGIAGDGTMQVPSDFARAGWLTAAPAPGQRGPAVIAGHVDSHEGPAVFFRLSELVAGDEVRVVQADGDVVSFTVRGKESFAKDEFPTDRVYGPVPGPVLRLITCSGEVDPVSGHYVDNTVVFAS
ncbi:class F sortase [Phycicoccus avicenniae]|uniref:class F sortase n=1 Tax=Phycicoccus avicenniae TaxID=2828860 RepID=UPI0024AFFA67|nr:class F sortase [Phycicoccus avicenniae]